MLNIGQSIEYQDKYKVAKQMYLEEGKSLIEIGKILKMDRGKLSNNFKKDGIEVINKHNLTKFNENFFDIIDTEEKAYWLGFLYADGSVSSTDNTIELSLQSEDFHHLEKFRKSLGFKEDKKISQDDIRARIMFGNKHMKQTLIKQGCPPKKSLILTFPSKEIVPDMFLYDFIRGYVDGDGSVMIGKNHLGFYDKPRLSILGTESFLKEMLERTQWKQNKIQHPSNIYCVEWAGYYVQKYLDQLYSQATIYLDRKYEKYLILKNNCRS